MLSAPRSPWQRAYIARVIGSIRRQCLDHSIVFNERSLNHHLRIYCAYYHRTHTHLALQKDCPEPRRVQPLETGRVMSIPEVGGLHHRKTKSQASKQASKLDYGPIIITDLEAIVDARGSGFWCSYQNRTFVVFSLSLGRVC